MTAPVQTQHQGYTLSYQNDVLCHLSPCPLPFLTHPSHPSHTVPSRSWLFVFKTVSGAFLIVLSHLSNLKSQWPSQHCSYRSVRLMLLLILSFVLCLFETLQPVFLETVLGFFPPESFLIVNFVFES